MNDFLLVALKLGIGFLALITVINITGKGNLAPTSASDQIQNYVLTIWCTLVLLLKWVKTHNVKAKQILDGKSRIIIDKGVVNVENCKKSVLSAHDVSFKLRTNNIYSTKKVKRAIVEQNGQFIIILDGEENPKFPLITDGQVQTDILDVMGRDEEWLLGEINAKGYSGYGEIFLGEYADGELNITPYQ